MSFSSQYQLGVVVSIRDRARSWMEDASERWEKLRRDIKLTGEDLEWLESQWGRMKAGIATIGIGATILALSGNMAMARVEATQLEAEIRSLGVSAAEVDSISGTASVLAARWGTAKNSILSGVYDIQSAVSELEGSSLGSFAESVLKTAKATKGDFQELSKTFGMVYNQFGDKYPWLSQEEFAESLGNTIAFTAQRFRADGDSIRSAFESLGASASAAGFTVEAQSVTIGRLLNTMVPSTAGTSLRAFIDRLPTAGEKLGIETFDQVTGKIRPIPDILDSIREKYPDLAKSSAVLNEAFSEEGVKFLKAMVPEAGKLRSEIRELSEMNAAKNFATLDGASATNIASLSGSIDRIREGFRSIWADMGAGPAGVLQSVLSPVADLVEGFASVSAQYPGMARVMGLTVTIGGVLAVVTGVVITANAAWTMYRILQYHSAIASAANLSASSAMGVGQSLLATRTWVATAAQWAFNSALWANPITWVVGAVLALAAGIAYVAYNYDTLSAKWNSMPEWVRYTLFAVTATLELVGAVVRFSRNAEDFESASRAAFGGLPGLGEDRTGCVSAIRAYAGSDCGKLDGLEGSVFAGPGRRFRGGPVVAWRDCARKRLWSIHGFLGRNLVRRDWSLYKAPGNGQGRRYGLRQGDRRRRRGRLGVTRRQDPVCSGPGCGVSSAFGCTDRSAFYAHVQRACNRDDVRRRNAGGDASINLSH